MLGDAMKSDANAEWTTSGRDQDVEARPGAGARTPAPAIDTRSRMARTPLYPLRFEPIVKTALWGGQRLPTYLNRTVGHNDPVGEAWILSDVDGSPSCVLDGPLAGQTLRAVLAQDPERVVGSAKAPQGR